MTNETQRTMPLDADGMPIDKHDLPDMTDEQREAWDRRNGTMEEAT